MSRVVIGAIVGVLIAVVTGIAYFMATSTLERRIRNDVKTRVAKAQELLVKTAELEMLGVLKKTEVLARDTSFAKSLATDPPDPRLADTAFKKFRAGLAAGERRPDIMALVDAKGRLVAQVQGDKLVQLSPIPDTYLNKDGKIEYPAIQLAIDKRQITSEVWDFESWGPTKAGVAPVVNPDDDAVLGSVIVAYAINATEAQDQQKLLGTDVVYFYDKKITTTSFEAAKSATYTSILSKPLFEGGTGGLAGEALSNETGFSNVIATEMNGDIFWATAGRLPRFSSQPLPAEHPKIMAGAMVMMSISEATSHLGAVKIAILAVGLMGLIMSLLAVFLTARQILGPLDEIETGVNDLINGNLERSFRPVGSDLDGLANALNVMLARLLGRPEPGEEEYDDQGNIVKPQAINVDSQLAPKDAEAVRLANEPELGYLRRLFEEYSAARQASGEGTDGLVYDTFVAKVKSNEANLVVRYKCSAVRFKVITKDGKVTLKPVPLS